MPGFAENLRRAREAAGLTPEELAGRAGVPPVWLAHLEAIGAALPDLPNLVRLAQALGCPVDALLAGTDEDFDHPRRRHAALIAARLGRVQLLLNDLKIARDQRRVSARDDRLIDEPSLLASVARCRAWVTSPTGLPAVASRLEYELDAHLDRLRAVCDLIAGRGEAVGAQGDGPRPGIEGRGARSGGTEEAPRPAAGKAPPSRPVGHRTVMWSRPATAGDGYECEMFSRAGEAELRIVREDRVLASRTCRNLDEAFTQSADWKRVSDLETLAAAAQVA